eukprot:Sdes_comp18831_c0_seq1m9252
MAAERRAAAEAAKSESLSGNSSKSSPSESPKISKKSIHSKKPSPPLISKNPHPTVNPDASLEKKEETIPSEKFFHCLNKDLKKSCFEVENQLWRELENLLETTFSLSDVKKKSPEIYGKNHEKIDEETENILWDALLDQNQKSTHF